MNSTNHNMNTKDTRKRSPTRVYAEVSGRGPLTRSRKALLNVAAETHSSVNLSPNGSDDEETQTGNSYSYPGTSVNEKGDGTQVGAKKSSKNAVVNEDPEITPIIGFPSVLPKKASSSEWPDVIGRFVPDLRDRNLVPPTIRSRQTEHPKKEGSSPERPDVIGRFVPDLRDRNLVPPTIRSRQTEHPKKEESPRKSTTNSRCTESPSRSFIWSVTTWILLLICTAVLSLLTLAVLWCSGYGKINLSRPVNIEQFHTLFTTLESSFPHQRDQLWRRSKIHLENHLKTQDPTEPVSLILAAGRGAEKTVRCLALSVASSFSSAYNASVLSIDGAGQAGYDGDQVKLYIDDQLQAAFEGEKPAVVIHRLEELPPSSTLIFYRYCDHENAAYKNVMLLFTVLLPQDEIHSDRSLKQVEELVQDHLLQKLVDSSNTGFNKMDADKFSGLWSRISHLILPVVSEGAVEKKGCEL